MKTNTTVTEKIIEGLRNTATELEKLRLQASLGKAEAKDLYEEAKKEFENSLQDAKLKLAKTTSTAKEKSLDVKQFLENLQVQFALGKAEAKDVFEEQRKKFSDILKKK